MDEEIESRKDLPKVITLVSGKGRIQLRQPVSESHSVLPPLIVMISLTIITCLDTVLYS